MSGSASGAVIFLIGGGAVALIGIALLIWVLLADRSRGRRRCPKCWYDLSKTEGLRCSECGHEVRRERQLFKTRRRWRWAALALLLILTGIGGIGWQRTRNFHWNTIKPVWWLLREADGAVPRAAAARKELVMRIRNKQLDDRQVLRIVDRALAVQADPNAIWLALRTSAVDDGWGDLVEEAWDQGALDNARVERYVRQGLANVFTMQARGVIASQAPLVARYEGLANARLSSRLAFSNPADAGLHQLYRIRSMRMGDQEILTEQFPHGGRAGRAFIGGWRTTPSYPCSVAPGRYQLTTVVEMIVRRTIGDDPFFEPGAEHDPNEVTRWTQEFVHTVEVLPVGEESVRLVASEELRAKITEAIQPEFVKEMVAIGNARMYGSTGMILVHPMPVNLSFDVFARVGEREEKIGAIAVKANQSHVENAQRIDRHPSNVFPDADRFDLVLRASPDAAEKTLDILEAWDGEIVIKDVPLRKDTPQVTPNGVQ